MTVFLTNAARLFLNLGPVADSQAFCAQEVSRENTRAQGRLQAEYAELFKSDLRQSCSAMLARR
ncbi:hypothetical protein [Microbulbifer sp. S227A]|uniref:hypothetical protein n=1 Tax=Microbulbifer sp. S227A TaxID=3415131 RepID=UPI003C79FE5F